MARDQNVDINASIHSIFIAGTPRVFPILEMPATDSAAIVVARFLRANHYNETLKAFLAESGLPEEAAITKKGDWTIEKILEEKRQYDSSLEYEKKGDEQMTGWPLPAPSKATEPGFLMTSNVLCVSGDGNGEFEDDIIWATGADRSWSSMVSSPPFSLAQSISNAHGSPILSIRSMTKGFILSTSMSGQLMMHDRRGRLLDKCRDHLKYAVQVVSGRARNGKWIVATAGWDQKVHIYAPEQELAENFDVNEVDAIDDEPYIDGLLRDPIHTLSMPSNPESMVLVRHPDTGDLYLIVSRRDSTFLYYYCITPTSDEASSSRTSQATYSVQETGKQNLAPHANAWIAFSPACLAVCPTDPTLLAVATSHLPHMKVIIVRLLFPSSSHSLGSNFAAVSASSELVTPAAQARADLALQDREDAAIKLHVTTMAPQTPYSTPQVVWRPGGHGVFVNADDGVVRGIDTQSGKVVAMLKAHEVGSKVRTLYAGWEKGGKDEILVSGGFDKKIFIWRVKD
ncbi:uncharacterized protein PV06_00768 [Exophiala oligosperma]|uniref:LisH domain-containing protein n=2 Tax=Chaetothyriales TaxID=34395 RepID=A0A0D2E029_9EURO|nr:uncharacterized protein PV06_00768 [Exophiala oligosperma]KAJ9618614.1 hypothetical protein H2204_012967 [Knufia peltigerae]KIW48150.1 hypothetical protein PV06_00768 [Exophiala oligosperma]